MVVTAVVGELVPQLVLVLALDYSGERSQRVPITAAMTMAMITRLMPVRLGLRFGIGAIPIRRITLPYPNAQFLGEKLFNNGLKNFGSRYAAFRIFRLRLDRCAPASKDLPSSGMPLRQRARSYGTPLGSQPIGGPPRSPASSSAAPRSRTGVCVPCNRTSEPIRLLNAA